MKVYNFISILLFIIFSGCLKSTYYKNANISYINKKIVNYGKVNFLTHSNFEYEIIPAYMDSVEIEGKGRYRKINTKNWMPFDGKVKIDSIGLVENSENTNLRKGEAT